MASELIHLDSYLVAAARATAEKSGRTVVHQIELWIRLGSVVTSLGQNASFLSNAERLIREFEVRDIIREAFVTDEAMSTWLTSADPALGMKTPLELLATEAGAAKVRNFALAMVHGIPP